LKARCEFCTRGLAFVSLSFPSCSMPIDDGWIFTFMCSCPSSSLYHEHLLHPLMSCVLLVENTQTHGLLGLPELSPDGSARRPAGRGVHHDGAGSVPCCLGRMFGGEGDSCRGWCSCCSTGLLSALCRLLGSSLWLQESQDKPEGLAHLLNP
jgi:hypothetical protein